MQDLTKIHCIPCEGGVAPMTQMEARAMRDFHVKDWDLDIDSRYISKTFIFDDFKQALSFVDSVGCIAEEEQHHPDIHLEGYKKVRIVLSTHAIGGLSKNDFIVAAKINAHTEK